MHVTLPSVATLHWPLMAAPTEIEAFEPFSGLLYLSTAAAVYICLLA